MTNIPNKWIKDWPDAVIEFCERYDASSDDPRLMSIFSTGGGMSMGDIAEVPGASKRFALAFQPYSKEDTLDFVRLRLSTTSLDDWDFCSMGASVHYYNSLNQMCNYRDYLYIAITAALTTTRWRKGNNRAFVTLNTKDDKTETWKISLSKHSEDYYESLFMEEGAANISNLTIQRRIEDNKISRAVMAIILNDPDFANLNDEEYIAKCDIGKSSVSRKHWLDGEG